MTDITTVLNAADGYADWVLTPAGLQEGLDLETAVLISLFSDQVAGSSDVIPDGSINPRGWWGDQGETYPIGSKLWLLRRSKESPQLLVTAQKYCLQALQWMLDDDVVASLTVTCSFPFPGALGIQVQLYDQDGTMIAKYKWAWAQLAAQPALSTGLVQIVGQDTITVGLTSLTTGLSAIL